VERGEIEQDIAR